MRGLTPVLFCASLLAGYPPAACAAEPFTPQIPKTWTASALADFQVPLANPRYSPIHIAEADYYRIPERVIYRSYPVYHPHREPAGYRQWLLSREPEIAFDVTRLKTRQDWIEAGKIVFEAPTAFNPVFFTAEDVGDPQFYEETGAPIAADGTFPFARWVIRKKGQIELGSMGCNTCHTRVLADGAVVAGAQSNNALDRQGARLMRRLARTLGPEQVLERMRGFAHQFEMPWLEPDPNRRARTLTLEEFFAIGEAIPAGVNARSHTSLLAPPQIPDLIGVAERRYLDHTGFVRHRDIGDLMRYAALVTDTLALARYGPFGPTASQARARYSDAQLYALALYLYSLKPPPNPHALTAEAARGKRIFEREGCPLCHTPPLYTNNKLIPVDGFRAPAPHKVRLDILEQRLGTDPRLALESRKGTGYYKVPSLKGLWYRAPLEHNGSIARLEDWFDPSRLRDDYVPTGFKGLHVERRAVKGHAFGLALDPAEKAALIAFLRTL